MKNHPLSKIKFMIFFVVIFCASFSIFTHTTFAQDVEAAPIEQHGLANGKYQPITPGAGDAGGFFNFGDSFEGMLQRLFEMGVMITVILSVIMIIWGGVEYMGSESVFAKGAGRERIQYAIWGLLIALVSILLISTILPGGTGSTFEIKIFG